MVLPQNLDFSLFCFNAKVINKKMFGEVLETKEEFLDYKNINLNKA